MGKLDLNEIFSRTFDKINLPSKGEFYKDNLSSFKIRYLSGIEEKVLTSDFLTKSGEALEMVLSNVILDDFDVRDLVISDMQGIMIFLYSTAYGDIIPYQMKCPSCSYEDELSVRLSDIDFKKSEYKPMSGKFMYYAPMKQNFLSSVHTPKVLTQENGEKFVEFVLSPITFGKELDMKKKGVDNKGINKIISSIKSIGGVTDVEYIENSVKRMNMQDFKRLREFSDRNEMALEDKISVVCPACGHEHKFQVNFGYDFLKLPEKHRENIMEECFLISHYSESGMDFQQAMNLPITERRWYLQRISEELEKKREAEKKAADAAKSGGGGRR